uniref:Uncharacterized protein n=1 Tax=Dulem virus 29 TaxID=3145747 RepID=A0AAU8B1K7_9CAUD
MCQILRIYHNQRRLLTQGAFRRRIFPTLSHYRRQEESR